MTHTPAAMKTQYHTNLFGCLIAAFILWSGLYLVFLLVSVGQPQYLGVCLSTILFFISKNAFKLFPIKAAHRAFPFRGIWRALPNSLTFVLWVSVKVKWNSKKISSPDGLMRTVRGKWQDEINLYTRSNSNKNQSCFHRNGAVWISRRCRSLSLWQVLKANKEKVGLTIHHCLSFYLPITTHAAPKTLKDAESKQEDKVHICYHGCFFIAFLGIHFDSTALLAWWQERQMIWKR